MLLLPPCVGPTSYSSDSSDSGQDAHENSEEEEEEGHEVEIEPLEPNGELGVCPASWTRGKQPVLFALGQCVCLRACVLRACVPARRSLAQPQERGLALPSGLSHARARLY